MSAEARSSETTVRVRYAETDQMGRAYYGAYFAWFEVARVELLREAGSAYADLEKQGVLLPVIEAQCRYLAPAVYDQLLRIVTRVVCTGKSRVEFASEVFAEGDGRAVATSRVVLACVGPGGKPRALPEPLREGLVEFDPSFGKGRGRAAVRTSGRTPKRRAAVRTSGRTPKRRAPVRTSGRTPKRRAASARPADGGAR